MWYFSLAMTAVYRVTASARLVFTHHEAQGAHRALAIQDMQLQAWNSDAAALVIDRGDATSVVVEIATMSEQYRLGAASDVAEEFLLPGDHKPRRMLCGKGALAVSSWQANAAKSSLEDGGRSGCDRGSCP